MKHEDKAFVLVTSSIPTEKESVLIFSLNNVEHRTKAALNLVGKTIQVMWVEKGQKISNIKAISPVSQWIVLSYVTMIAEPLM